MLDELLPYYNQELINIRQQGEEFAATYPKVASHLRWGPGSIEDPHVARLIESFAFLNAHIRHKLDDDFPELSDALLSCLYPHYQRPVPSTSIVQFKCEPELSSGYFIEKNTQIETAPLYKDTCYFNTAYPVMLWPIEITNVSINGLPFQAPLVQSTQKVASILHLQLTCLSEKMTFAKFPLKSLRVFINAQLQNAYALYELLFNNVITITIANSATDPNPIILSKENIKLVGYERDEGLFPYPAHSLLGYRLFTEFFTFPEKFLFFEITGLDTPKLQSIGHQLEIYFYLNYHHKILERNIGIDSFQLGCTPVVNLFRQVAEPIRLNHTVSDYLVIPDLRRLSSIEVYSVESVKGITNDEQELDYLPFYDIKHRTSEQPRPRFWHMKHKNNTNRDKSAEIISNVYLSFTDLDFNPLTDSESVVTVKTLCTNGNVPSQLPFGGSEPHLQLTAGTAPLTTIKCLTPFTPTIYPTLRNEARWKLISHLSLNHLSLVETNGGTEALKEMFKLYNLKNSIVVDRIIDGLLKVSSRQITTRSPEGFVNALAQGLEITLHFDETQFIGSGLFLFGQILERFFSGYVSINSFTKLIVTTSQTEGIRFQWFPRVGERILL